MFNIKLNSIKTRVRLFFIINIALVIFNYIYTAYYNNESEKVQRHVEVSRDNAKITEKLEYVTKAIVIGGESELKKVLEKDMKTYSDNLDALKLGGEAVIGDELVKITPPEKGRRQLKTLENTWNDLKKQLQIIIDKKVEIDSSITFFTDPEAQANEKIQSTDSLNIAQKKDSTRKDSVALAQINAAKDSIGGTEKKLVEDDNNNQITYFDINQEVEKAYFLAQTAFDEVLNKNRELSDVYQANFNNSQVWLRTILLITFLLNLLVLVGGTFVIGTYLVNPLKQIASTAKEVASGDTTTKVVYNRQDEIGEVAESLNLIVGSFKQYTEFAENIGRGNFDAIFEVKSEKDTLGYALQGMRNNLKAIDDEDYKRNWANEGFALFSNILRSSDQDLEEFSYQIISNLVKYLEANQGGLFMLMEEDGRQYLEMKAAFAYNKRKYEEKRVLVGQGLLGQSVVEKDIIYLDDVPGEYIQITSGLGKASPRCLLIAPLMVNDVTYGAIEVASFKQLERYEIEFVTRLAESIASTLSTLRINENTKHLLDETRQYAEQMQAQEEEMRQNMEELAATQEEMEKNQYKLEEYKRNLEKEVENRTVQLREKERALSNALTQMQGIMDSSRAGIVALDNQFKVVAANYQMHELFRLIRGRDFKLGDDWFSLYSDSEERNRMQGLWARAFSGIYYTIEESYTLTNNTRRWLEISFSPIMTQEKEVIGASMFVRDISERKKELKNIELTAHILDNSSNEVYVFDANSLKFVIVNERARLNLGFSQEEILHLTPYDIEPHHSRETFLRQIEPLQKGEVEYLLLDTTHIRKDGTSYEVELNLQLFEDEDTPLFAAIAQDISQRKQNEVQLTEAVQRFDLATSATKEGLWEMEIVGKDPINPDAEIWWSKKYLDILGYNETEFPNKLNSWLSRIHPDDKDWVSKTFLSHIIDTSGQSPYDVEYRILHKNGQYIWLAAIAETLRDSQGNPRKIAGSIRDITRRKKAEKELLNQTAIVNGILNAAVNSIISFDTEGKILSANPATMKIFGYSQDELLGKPLDVLIANGKLDFSKMLDNITETEGRRKEGSLFPIEVSVSETMVSNQKIYVGILRDNTAKKNLVS
jgi:PAS domain S-box-containing protein